MADRQRWIRIARGDEPADLVISGGRVVSVFTDEIFEADVAIADGYIVGVGSYAGRETIDATGKYITPGFIDGHCHIESSKLSVHEFARAVLACGTTTVVVDPHELANVLGIAGIEYVLDASEDIPLDVRVMIPSCVPASGFESPLKELRTDDFRHLLEHPRVLGLAEMMNYPAVVAGDVTALDKLEAFAWENIDGHAPSVTGRDLNAYLVGGPHTDHESVTVEEALEKRRLGMWVMIREASMIRNLVDLLPLVADHGTENTCFVTDDREADTLLHEGHINAMVRLAVENGVPVGSAVKLASLNVARCHGLKEIGAVAPGYRADLCIFPDLKRFQPDTVLSRGRTVAISGKALPFETTEQIPEIVRHTVNIKPLLVEDFRIQASATVEGHIIELVHNQVVTRDTVAQLTSKDGHFVADVTSDHVKLAVIERHNATGRMGLGFVRGFGMKHGAVASTVAHDAHNIVVAGVDDGDMLAAVNRIVEIHGGAGRRLRRENRGRNGPSDSGIDERTTGRGG